MNDVTRKVLINHMEINRRNIAAEEKRRADFLAEITRIEGHVARIRDESAAIREALQA